MKNVSFVFAIITYTYIVIDNIFLGNYMAALGFGIALLLAIGYIYQNKILEDSIKMNRELLDMNKEIIEGIKNSYKN